MDCMNYDSMRDTANRRQPEYSVRNALLCTALCVVVAATVLLALDRAHITVPVVDETATSAGQA